MSLNIVLLGTGEFAVPPFTALLQQSEHNVVGVYTQPDRTGRGHHRHVNRVKQLAEQHGVPVFQPHTVNAQDALDELRSLNADVFIVAAYGQIMKPEFLAIPRLGAFNLHGSLLPRHRGAAPVQYSIWKGDRDTGVTIFQIEPALDSGPMVGKVETTIGPKETSGELMLRLAELSVPLTVDIVNQLAAGTAQFQAQDASQVTFAPKIRKDDGNINWNQSATEIDCHVRAMQPWPRASSWLHSEGRSPVRCILLNVEPVTTAASGTPGDIDVAEKQMRIHTGNGLLKILRLQPEGKQAMDAIAFLNGYGITSTARFAST
ncbi:MAG: methionyl-tRNA formyltransferase [Planctomycetaceae bacterium]